jgi:hypothetical protein
MTTAFDHLAESFSAIILGITSSMGPGGTGTTILIGRLGYSCATELPIAAPSTRAVVKILLSTLPFAMTNS